ncbi:MAG TPA: amidohydrolase family protein [Mycobacteriales bacterium]|jgi:imidazolonepropionase-like amidohydrolase|nr:amidohydrolase family protein [Mycobacteriales bacterium]
MTNPARTRGGRAAGWVRDAVWVAVNGRRALRRDDPLAEGGLGRGVALRGRVWPGGTAEAYDGVVLIGPDGTIERIGPPAQVSIPVGVRVIGAAHNWIGPGIVDAHVHLAFGTAEEALRGGVVGVRDLGAPRRDALRRRTGHRRPPPGVPYVGVAGPILTATGGYPSRSWGADGFASFLTTPAQARLAVRGLAGDGVDLVKVAVERGPDGAWPVPSTAVLRAVVDAAHGAGLKVVAHALTAEAVGRVLDAGVDELAHTPVEPLPEALVDRVAAAGIPVVSTLQTFFSDGAGRAAAANAAALHRAGVPLVYGTDLGNAGTRTGVDPRELDRLADAGLGRAGALRAATLGSAGVAGMRLRTGLLEHGRVAAAVLLNSDPLVEPGVWRRPRAVVCDGRLVEPPEGAPDTLGS